MPRTLPDADLSETLHRHAGRRRAAIAEAGFRPPRGHVARLGRLIRCAGGNRRRFHLA